MSNELQNSDQRAKFSWIDRQINEIWAMLRRGRTQPTTTTDGGFFAKVTAATRDGINWRWTYQIAEAAKTSTGFASWTTLSGGRVGTAYNTIEAFNGPTGTPASLLGNGVSTANLGNLQPQPVPVGTILRAYAVTIGSATEFAFSYENGIDGTC